MSGGILTTSSTAGSSTGLGGAFMSISGASFFTASTYGAGVLFFLIAFALLVCGLTNEVVIARRLIMYARVAIILLVGANGLQLSLDMELPSDSSVSPPSFRLVRPIIELVLLFLAFFVSSHHVFRWLVVLFQPLFIIAETFTGVIWWSEMECRAAGTCLKQQGYSERQVQMLAFLQFVMVFLQIQLVFSASYLLMAMGACHSRYPVRLFSVTKPLSQSGVSSLSNKQQRRSSASLGSGALSVGGVSTAQQEMVTAPAFGAKASALATAGFAVSATASNSRKGGNSNSSNGAAGKKGVSFLNGMTEEEDEESGGLVASDGEKER